MRSLGVIAERGSATVISIGLGAAAPLRKADLHAADQRADRVVDGLLFDAVIFQRLLIDLEAQALGALAEAVVRIDDEIDRVESLAHLRRESAPRLRVGTIDFGEQGRQHGRARRHFDDLDRGMLRRAAGLRVACECRARSHGSRACARPSAAD